MLKADHFLLAAALAGFKQQLAELDAKMADVEKELARKRATHKKIADAQRRRWAAYRQARDK